MIGSSGIQKFKYMHHVTRVIEKWTRPAVLNSEDASIDTKNYKYWIRFCGDNDIQPCLLQIILKPYLWEEVGVISKFEITEI